MIIYDYIDISICIAIIYYSDGLIRACYIKPLYKLIQFSLPYLNKLNHYGRNQNILTESTLKIHFACCVAVQIEVVLGE